MGRLNAGFLTAYWSYSEDDEMENQTSVVCPRNSAWLAKMLDVLPVGLRGKLAPYENCLNISRRVVRSKQRQPKHEKTVVRPVLR